MAVHCKDSCSLQCSNPLSVFHCYERGNSTGLDGSYEVLGTLVFVFPND